MFRLVVDPDVCEANGLCARLAPELFELGEGDFDTARVLRDPVPAELREPADRAVRACPKQAIRLV